jgi:bifunctional non-homologous end joining protein LigD
MRLRASAEGISKKATSRYVSGRSPAWRKTKCMTESEFVVIGAEPNPGGAPFALLAREAAEWLVYAGSAFVTLSDTARERFWTDIDKLAIRRPVVPRLRGENRKATWCRPEMKVRARHLKGGGEMLRHGTLIALL